MSDKSNMNDDNNYTPETLAWTLIMDDNINDSGLLIFSEENNNEIIFEILITIYVEMIFNYYKLKYLESQYDSDNVNFDDNFDNFKLDINQINMFTLTNVFKTKFNKLKIILNVKELTQEEYETSRKHRYCTILLRDSPHDNTYFVMNEKYIDKHKKYHFVLNSLYSLKENLRDIYCTFAINSKYFKIYFTKF
jgi:hypothetical protein